MLLYCRVRMGGWMGGFRKAQKRDPLETDAARSWQSATLHLQKRDPLETDAARSRQSATLHLQKRDPLERTPRAPGSRRHCICKNGTR